MSFNRGTMKSTLPQGALKYHAADRENEILLDVPTGKDLQHAFG